MTINKKNIEKAHKNHKILTRCSWVSDDPLYQDYHDHEWGVAEYDNQKLFEKLCLEGQQAGLSWITVLKKRQAYRTEFHQFDPQKIVKMTDTDLDRLMQNSALIRYRKKLQAIIKNAHAYLAMIDSGEDFSQFIWSFVEGKPIINHLACSAQALTRTATSDAMAKALKKRGFSFVGSTSCYAYMQSMGLVNDHSVDCFCYQSKLK